MRTLLLSILALTVMPAAASVAAPAPAAEKRVTLRLERVRLRQAVDRVAEVTGERLVVFGHVPDLPVSLHLEDATARDAVRRLVTDLRRELPDLTAYASRGYVIKRRWLRETGRQTVWSMEELPGLEERVSLRVVDLPLGEAVRRLVEPTGVNYKPVSSP